MQEVVHDAQRLKELRELPLWRKVQISQARIIEWYQYWNGNVYVSFSGGKDSTVLLHLVQQIYPNVQAVFSNTGLEFPEIQKFARLKGATFVSPSMRFDQVITEYGYPLISKEVAEAIHYARKINTTGIWEKDPRQKNQFINTSISGKRRTELHGKLTHGGGKQSHSNKEKWLYIATDLPIKISHYCCDIMKKRPLLKYHKATKTHPYIGTLAEESRIRKEAWIKHGCNVFDSEHPISQPISFWTEQDILAYIVLNKLQIASVYGDIMCEKNGAYYQPIGLDGEVMDGLKCTGCSRTGCIFCGFGFHLDRGKTRFQKLAETHPRQYEYCIRGGQWIDNPDYIPNAPEYDGEWKNWNPRQIWVPSKEGLGMGRVFDMVNEIYGKDFYRYA